MAAEMGVQSMIRGLFVCALLIPGPALAQSLSGLGQVVDGDSLSVGGISVRLFGIDAPEGKQTCDRDGTPWACGQESANQLRMLVASNRVECHRVSVRLRRPHRRPTVA